MCEAVESDVGQVFPWHAATEPLKIIIDTETRQFLPFDSISGEFQTCGYLEDGTRLKWLDGRWIEAMEVAPLEPSGRKI